jgi:RNA polymerase sigma-70 factor, ECF subfamily
VTFFVLGRLEDMSVPFDVMTDSEIVRHVRRGEREAYRVLVHRYQDTLFRTALSLVRDRDVAAEMVQAAFVSGYSELKSLRDDGSFGGWVYRGCVNRCRDWLKSRRRRDVALDDSPAELLTSHERTDSALERGELRRTLDGALATLSDEYREAFVLKHVDERSYEEMSELLNVSVPALKMRVHRAREALKSALEEVL